MHEDARHTAVFIFGDRGDSNEREVLWTERVAQWRVSGLSQGAFAVQHDFEVFRFGCWVRRLGASSATAAMLPVTVKREPVSHSLCLRSLGDWTLTLARTSRSNRWQRCCAHCDGDGAAGVIALAGHPASGHTKGIDGFLLHVQQALGRAPCDGTAYVFSSRRRTHLKLVC